MGDSTKLAGVSDGGGGAVKETDHRDQSEGGEKMEAYRIDRFGSVDGIVLRSNEDPRPGPKEILMRVRASSLNYRDLMVLKGGSRSDKDRRRAALRWRRWRLRPSAMG
jgi:hypothetical protein